MVNEYIEIFKRQGVGLSGKRQQHIAAVDKGRQLIRVESVAQVAQRIIHSAQDTNTGQAHDFALVKSILREELADILRLRKDALGSEDGAAAERYEKASKIAAHWIKNYTEFNYRSLGSYTRADLEEIAALEDASVGPA